MEDEAEKDRRYQFIRKEIFCCQFTFSFFTFGKLKLSDKFYIENNSSQRLHTEKSEAET